MCDVCVCVFVRVCMHACVCVCELVGGYACGNRCFCAHVHMYICVWLCTQAMHGIYVVCVKLAATVSPLSISILLCQFPFPVHYAVGPVSPPPGYRFTPPPHGWPPPHQGEGVLPRTTCELWPRLILSPHTVLYQLIVVVYCGSGCIE